MNPVTIRRLESADAADFRRLRLRALTEFPDFYTATYDEEAAADVSVYRGLVETHLAYGAFLSAEMIATGVVQGHAAHRLRHKCTLSAVYVVPEQQGRGIGRRLLAHLLGEAAEHYELALIAADSHNIHGIHLYESLGFRRYGLEPRALKDGERYLDDLLLMKTLRDAAISVA